MKHNAKKILAMLLSFVLVLSLVPAAAAGGIPDRDDIDVLMYELYILAYVKYAEDYEAHHELLNAQDALFDAYVTQAHEVVTDEVVTAYNSALAVYQKYTATVAVDGVSIDPGSFQTLTVGELVTVKAEVSPDNATNKNVIWSVNGTGVTLYADQACTTPVSSPTSLLTVYAKATEVGSGAVIVNSSQEGITPATFNFEVKAAGYTVTYAPGDGASLKDGIQPPDGYKVDGKNIVKTGVKGEYKIEGLESCFNAPEGKVFDCWKDANGTEYREGQKVDNVTANLTLTAQWKEEKKPDGGEKKTGGSGSGFDLVFNIPGEDNSWGYGGGYAPQQAYRVSLAPMQGGSAALGLTTGESTETAMNVYPTTTVYVFPNAEQGYVLDKIVWSLIDGSASYDITEAKNFVMPAMDAVVYVTFKPVG